MLLSKSTIYRSVQLYSTGPYVGVISMTTERLESESFSAPKPG